MQHRTVQGRIQYTSQHPDSFNQNRGSEQFILTTHGDGCLTVRTTSALELPEPKILRDVIASYDALGRLTDCHLRVSVADRLMGTAWYLRQDDVLEMQSWSPAAGRQEARCPWDGSIGGLITHPVFNDGHLFKTLDLSQGPHRRRVDLLSVSPDHRGATPPVIVPIAIWMEYVGDESVTVSAGTFKTRHFRYVDEGGSGLNGKHPDINVWVTADDDYVYVKGEIGGYFMSSYELMSYEQY